MIVNNTNKDVTEGTECNKFEYLNTFFFENEESIRMFIEEDRISYEDYIYESPQSFIEYNNEKVNNWECEWNSELDLDNSTNDSFSVYDGERENDDPEEYLRDIGILVKGDDTLYFDFSFRDDTQNIEELCSVDEFWHNSDKKQWFDEFIYEEKFWESEGFNPVINIENWIEWDNTKNQTQNSLKLNNNSKKKLTEFNYLLQRKGFRLMRKYYKEKFESFAQTFDYKKRVKILTPGEINQIMVGFIRFEFSSILSLLAHNELEMLLESLKWVIFSDRSNKSEQMTEGIDFSIVKNLFGKYTKKNMITFMNNAANSFLYTHFYLIHGRSAWFEQMDVDQNNFKVQMRNLMIEGFKYLFSSVKDLYKNIYHANSSKI